MSQTVLAFDIGIRNLAWCLMEKKESKYVVLGWQNYDLLRGEGNENKVEAEKCYACKAKASYTSTQSTCVRHCPPLRPPLADLSGNKLKKLPSMAAAKEILAKHGALEKTKTKADVEAALAKHYSLPIVKAKVKKAVDHELTVLHDAIRKFITDAKPLFQKATHILLENQPVLKNPTMKTVQILLFATLRDLLVDSKPSFHLVHAGKKVKVEKKGDAGYKDRKSGSEDRVFTDLEKNTERTEHWTAYFKGHAKKNDLADAFCMCVDRLSAA